MNGTVILSSAGMFKDELVNLDAQSPRATRLSAQVRFISDFVAERAGAIAAAARAEPPERRANRRLPVQLP